MTAIHKPLKSISRSDIQWIRAVAVIVVVWYHIWPDVMPLGFLGVDMFFVVSGYLMTSIFAKTHITCSSVFQFYTRRIKRILPACMLVVSVTVYLAYQYFLPEYFEALKKEAIGAMTFSTNIQAVMTDRDYFFQLSELTFLLHTWSLGVEMQFYALAPAIFAIILSVKYPLMPIIMLAIPSMFLHSCFLSTISGFHLLFARIWQFMFGSIAFYHEDLNTTLEKLDLKRSLDKFFETKKYRVLWILFLIIIGILLFGHRLFVYYIRLIVTSVIGYGISQNYEVPKTKVWNYANNFMVYVGDASYSIYLVHWPLIQFARYYNYDEYFSSFIPLLIIVCIASVFIYEIFEKPMRNLSFTVNGFIILIFYIVSVYLCLYGDQPAKVLSKYPAIENAIQMNEKLAVFHKHPCHHDETITKYFPTTLVHAFRCSYEVRLFYLGILFIDTLILYEFKPLISYFYGFKNITSTRVKKEAVIIANSFGEYHLPAISEALEKAKFTKFYVFLQAGCLPYSRTMNYEHRHYNCDDWVNVSFNEFLDFVKPEIIILSARLSLFKEPLQPLPSADLLKADHATIEFHEKINNFAKHTKHLILISPNPDIDVDNVYVKHLKHLIKFKWHSPLTIARALHQGFSLKKYVIPWKFMYETTHPPEVRLLTAIADCSNCHFFNTTKIYCNKLGCPLYDENTKLGLFTDFSHVSNFGAKKMIQPLFNMIKNLTVI